MGRLRSKAKFFRSEEDTRELVRLLDLNLGLQLGIYTRIRRSIEAIFGGFGCVEFQKCALNQDCDRIDYLGRDRPHGIV